MRKTPLVNVSNSYYFKNISPLYKPLEKQGVNNYAGSQISFGSNPQKAPGNAFIQYRKDIGGTIVFGNYPKDYLKLAERVFVDYQPQKTVIRNGNPRIIKERPAHFEETYVLLPHYHIDKLWSNGEGSGTKAIQDVVRKSLADAQTAGRVTVDASCIDGKTAPGGFYYKLGFRFVNKLSNEECENWLKSGGDKANAPFVTGMMFLPEENIQKCLEYGI